MWIDLAPLPVPPSFRLGNFSQNRRRHLCFLVRFSAVSHRSAFPLPSRLKQICCLGEVRERLSFAVLRVPGWVEK